MPFVHIRIAGRQIAPAEVEALQVEATRLMAGVMHKKPELTAVLVEAIDGGRWSVGGAPVAVAAHLAVTVTAGTNHAADKAAFVDQAHAMLRAAVGPDLPLATYVVVEEIAADSWGYGGRTQEARRLGLA